MHSTEKSKDAIPYSAWYAGAMEELAGVIQHLSQVRAVDAIGTIVCRAARDLTGADGATFVLRDDDECYYADERAIGPLWKGKRFPLSVCISGWVMRKGRPALIEDIYGDARIAADAYRPTFVKSLAMVPIRRMAPIGAIGNYWASQRVPTAEELSILQALADTASVALQNADLYDDLRQQVRTRNADAMAASAPSRTGGEAPLANVLLADDMEDHLELIRLMLFGATGLQCNVQTARDGKEALEVIQKAAGTPDEIDFILLDIDMPGMDGFEFMEQLHRHEELKDLAVVMCSGSTYDDDRQRAHALGAAGYLIKPPSWERLKPIVDNIEGVQFQQDSEGGRLLRAG